MKKRDYKFSYDPQTGLYTGITRDLSLANSTDIEPIYDINHKTCFDFKDKNRKLVKREDYWQLVGRQDQIKEYEFKLEPMIYDLGMFITEFMNSNTKSFNHIDQHLERVSSKILAEQVKNDDRSLFILKDVQYTTKFLKLEIDELKNLIIHHHRPWYQKLFDYLKSALL